MKEFVIGHPYFLLSYLDNEFRFPEIISVVYLGMNLEEGVDQGEDDLWFFQDAASYLSAGPYMGSNEEVATAAIGSVSPAGQVYDFPESQLQNILTARELAQEIQTWIKEA